MAAFPTSVATDSDLYIAVNSTSTQLTDNPLSNSATTVNVVSTAAFPSVGFISIDTEIIKYTGKTATTFNGCTRASDGTTAASHVQNSFVFHNVIAAHHNVLKDDLIATQQFISDLIGRTNTQVKAPDGTAALPGISFAADTDTGIYRVGANIMGFATNGLIQWVINASGALIGQQTGGVIKLEPGTAAIPAYSFSADTDTGIYNAGANSLGFAVNGGQRMILGPSALTVAFNIVSDATASLRDLGAVGNGWQRLYIGDGSAGAPSIAFEADTNTGWYRGTTDDMRAATGGTNAMIIDNTSLYVRAGNVNSPGYTFIGDQNTGMYNSAADTLNFGVGGVERFRIDAAQIFLFNDGSNLAPALSWQSDSNTGIYHSADDIIIGTGGSAAMDLSNTQVSIESGRQFIIPSGKKFLLDGSGSGDTYIIETSANLMDFFAGGTKVISAQGSGVAVIGTNTNNSAAAGFIGEYVVSNLQTTSSAATSTQFKDYTSISLTAGDWDVTGMLGMQGNGATYTNIDAAISTNSGNTTTDHVFAANLTRLSRAFGTADFNHMILPVYRLSLSATTTVYLKGAFTFSAGTPNMNTGQIAARRVR